MYTAYIGRRLIDLYNERLHDGDEPLSPRTFFDEVFYPLFFDDERYLMWFNNSPFAQKYIQQSRRKKPLTKDIRREALEELHEKAEDLDEPYGHLVMGGYAVEKEATTSGQVTDLSMSASPEEVYCSWVGMAAGVGTKGGYPMLIDDDDVLVALAEGWKYYRQFMRDTEDLVPHQTETWNGWWLTHRFSRGYNEKRPLLTFNPDMGKKAGDPKINTQDWIRVIFSLARLRPEDKITAYVYNFGQENSTIGFIQLDLPAMANYREVYEHLFGGGAISTREALRLYQTENAFRHACEQGRIGLRAVEPKDLRKYFSSGKNLKSTSSTKKQALYNHYQTWIIAMLNNEDLLDFAQETAEALRAFAASEDSSTTGRQRKAEAALKAGGRRAFIDELTGIVEKDAQHAETFDRLVTEVVKMPSSDFPLLQTLIKFKYAVAKS
jgi:hypothetical protein